MKCYLIRHGATKGNQEGRYVGSTDEPVLSEQLEKLIKLTSILSPVDYVFTSPYLRCRQSAQEIFSGFITAPEVIWDFREIDFGEFEYKNYQELNGNIDYQRFIDSGGTIAFPGGEEPEHFKIRCCYAFLSCVRKARDQGFTVLGFSLHGGTIMAVMEALGIPSKDYFAYQVKNGGGYEAEVVWEPRLQLLTKTTISIL